MTACNAGANPSATPTSVISAEPSATATPEPFELTIYGAASLRGALEAAELAYQTAYPWIEVVVSTDSSAALRTQIEQGAPADAFLSADTKNSQTLVDAGLTDGDAVAFAGNLLAIIVPSDNRSGVTSPADLARTGLKVIAAGDEVPITKYANQLVANLAALPDYPADFAAAYAANIVSREENAKSVVTKIETGEGDAGIVYVTDAAASDKVTTLGVPAGANVPATYAGVVVKASNHRDAAHAFLDWLTGADGQALLAGFGFSPPPA